VGGLDGVLVCLQLQWMRNSETRERASSITDSQPKPILVGNRSTLHWIIIEWKAETVERQSGSLSQNSLNRHSNVLIPAHSRRLVYQLPNPILKNWMSFSNVKNVLMVSCLKSIFYFGVIARQRSYRRNQICHFFFTRFSWNCTNETENSLSRSRRVRFFSCRIEVNSVLPDTIARLPKVVGTGAWVSSAEAIRNMQCLPQWKETKCLSTTAHTLRLQLRLLAKAKRKNSSAIKSRR
jgi:hypothetical protein